MTEERDTEIAATTIHDMGRKLGNLRYGIVIRAQMVPRTMGGSG